MFGILRLGRVSAISMESGSALNADGKPTMGRNRNNKRNLFFARRTLSPGGVAPFTRGDPVEGPVISALFLSPVAHRLTPARDTGWSNW